jgi:ribosomal-protein-alanine N-acetyltransferase
MPSLERLRADHAPAVLAFERANRAFFAATIGDRGDDYFTEFPARHRALLAEQEAGAGAFYVLVADDGAVLGRVNLFDIAHHTAVLGYRLAEHATGRGLATAAVRDLCRRAASDHDLHTLRAAAAHDNPASQRVLTKTGFVPTGPATPGGRAGTWYQLELGRPPVT